jgi:hypothetical protein
VSYDIAVWVGEPPESDEAAASRFAELGHLLEQPPRGAAPDSTVVAFADDLLDRYADITEDAGEDSPWSTGPLKNEILGSLFYFPMRYDKAEEALPFIVERATARQLVCFDPQTERLLTPPAKRRRTIFGR